MTPAATAGPPTSATLSAVVLTRNEEREIADCLATLRFCDEIVVVDSNSTDGTPDLARVAGARVVPHQFTSFSAARNAGLEEARGDWVLFVDADERIPDRLRDEIQRAIRAPTGERGFRLRRDDCFCGQWLRHGETSRVRLLRLARRGAGRWVGRVHEHWDVAGPVGELSTAIHHYSHRSIADFVARLNAYSTLDAAERFENGVRESPWRLLANPAGKFVQGYVVMGGALDGTMGLVLAACMSFYSFLVRAKLMLLWRSDRGA